MENLEKKILEELSAIEADLGSSTKAGEARVRKHSLILEKLMKEYRKLSISYRK